ncbi:MAG: T9SS type A sorting domain-containing protein, partial [Candidatus Kapaibacteriales bacterium]
MGEHTIEINTSDLPMGIYFCTIKAGDNIETVKFVK